MFAETSRGGGGGGEKFSFLEYANRPRVFHTDSLCIIWGQTECIMGNWKIVQ